MYYHGEGVGKDRVRALEWFRKAAEQGDITSMFNLAYGYEHGDGVTRDMNESRRWYGKAAEQRNALKRVDFKRLTKTFKIPAAAQPQIAKALAEQKRIPSPGTAGEAPIAAGAATAEAAPVRTAAPDEGKNGDTTVTAIFCGNGLHIIYWKQRSPPSHSVGFYGQEPKLFANSKRFKDLLKA